MSEFIPKEIVKQAKQIDLLTYFMNNNPSELVKKGASTYSLKSHDSVIISNGLWHRFSTNEAGKTAVDYLMKVEKMTLQEAVKNVLNKDISTYKVHKTEINNVPRQIIIPEGYEYVSSETFYRMYDVKYNFVNTVPVVALEYKNRSTGEIAFPYSGTPIQLENERQKTLS